MSRTAESHFWAGTVDSPEALAALFAERYGDDDAPISQFAADQGEEFYDNDFLEVGRAEPDLTNPPPPAELADDHSYAEQWGEEFAARVAARGLAGVNMLAFINAEEIEVPRDCEGPGYRLTYLGTIRYTT